MRRDRPAGFALVITLVLLALLVLAVFALSALTKVGNETAASAVYHTQARQHALLGLSVALGELQRRAGDDARVTGMAGIAGVAGGATATTRYWCGVWQSDGAFLGWLVSGAVKATAVSGEPIELVATGTVGAAASTSANAEKEPVIAGKVPVIAPNRSGIFTVTGAYAYLVMDEGVKIGLYAPTAERALTGTIPVIGSSMLANQLKLRTTVDANAASMPAMLSYEQLGLLPSVTPSVLQDCFHYVTLTPRWTTAAGYRAGLINLNTSSTLVWRSLLDTYNSVPGVIPVTNVTARGNQLGNNFAASAIGKTVNSPFTSLGGFAAYLATVFPATTSPDSTQIMAALGPLFTVRSDTFRIRAYGEAASLADPTRIESTAYCEAIVQRTTGLVPGFGRRFVVSSFRWLGPDDI
jgi:hypothetical protein